MKSLRTVTFLIAFLLGAGEIARWWGQPRFLPMALDELVVAGAMLWAAVVVRRSGSRWLAGAWGLYCGLMLSLLVQTLDHLLSGPPKPSAGFYAGILAVMLAVGLWALHRSIALIREPPSRH